MDRAMEHERGDGWGFPLTPQEIAEKEWLLDNPEPPFPPVGSTRFDRRYMRRVETSVSQQLKPLRRSSSDVAARRARGRAPRPRQAPRAATSSVAPAAEPPAPPAEPPQEEPCEDHAGATSPEVHAGLAPGSASFVQKSQDRKLSPTQSRITGGRERFKAIGPFVSATYTSIATTCSDECPYKVRGCYETAGLTKFRSRKRDRAALGYTSLQVIAEEVRLIDSAFGGGAIPQDGARGGRDLRLHVGGDVGSAEGARLLGAAAVRYRERGGGTVWTYTHAWTAIPRAIWGSVISVLGSVERPVDIELARAAGYAAAITLEEFPSTKAFSLPGTTARVIPCPAETQGTTCATCRLCLDDRKLLARNVAIAFALHGPSKKKAAEALVQLRRKP